MDDINLALADIRLAERDGDDIEFSLLDGSEVDRGFVRFRFSLDGGFAETRERLQAGRVALQADHDGGKVLGVVTRMWRAGERLRGAAKFADTEAPQAILRNLRAGRYPRGISAGLTPLADRLVERATEAKAALYEITKWRLNEASLVGAPAQNVGLAETGGTIQMTTQEITLNRPNPPAPPPPAPALTPAQADRAELLELGDMLNQPDEARKSIALGESPDQFRARMASVMLADKPFTRDAEMTDGGKGFNLARLIHTVHNPNDAGIRKAADVELAMVSEAYDRRDEAPAPTRGGLMLPLELMVNPPRGIRSARDVELAVARIGGTANSFADEVEETIRGEWLRTLIAHTPVLGRVRVLRGLVGDEIIPRLTRRTGDTPAANPQHVANDDPSTAITDFTPGAVNVKLEPKTAISQFSMTRLADLQTRGAASAAIRQQVLEEMSAGYERAIMVGSGASGEATGVTVSTATGIATQSLTATNKAATFAEWGTALGTLLGKAAYGPGVAAVLNTESFVSGLTTFVNANGGNDTLLSMLESPMSGGYEARMFGLGFAALHSPSLKTGTGVAADGDVIAVLADWSTVYLGIWADSEIIRDDVSNPLEVTTSVLSFYDVGIARPDSLVMLEYDMA